MKLLKWHLARTPVLLAKRSFLVKVKQLPQIFAMKRKPYQLCRARASAAMLS